MFDGDEMNIHAVQSYEAEAELRMLTNTEQHIITAQESKPIITITQDSLIAAFLMTRNLLKLTRNEFCDISMKGERIDGSPLYNPERIKVIKRVLGNKEILNGRGLISLILPPSLNYEKENKAYLEEPVVKIRQGVFLEGALDKSILGSAHGSLIQVLNKEYGSKVTANFIDNIQFLGNAWLLIHGYSVGLEDCMITSTESLLAIKDTLAQCYTKAEGIEETTQNPGIREVRITAALSQAKDIGMRIAKDAMSTENNFLVSVQSGAKGDYFNIAQLTGLLGQQNLEGQRVAYTLSHGRRSLPHYPFDGLDKEREYESRGFVRHSFIHGLTPEEFFFHAMSGREGVCDTALSTARSGYIQRKIVKICEDIQVQYDRTVRDSSGHVYQFAYGENNYDPTKTVRVRGKPTVCDIERLADRLNLMCEESIVEEDEDESPPIHTEIIQPSMNERIEAVNKTIQDLDLCKEGDELSEAEELDEDDEDAERKDAKEIVKDDDDEPKKEEDEEDMFIFDAEGDDYEDGGDDFNDGGDFNYE